MDNPFQETSRSHQLFEVLVNADRPLRPEEVVASVGESNASAVQSMLKELRARGIAVYRYRDLNGTSPTSSVYALRPAEGFVELASRTRPRATSRGSGSPEPVRLNVHQPTVGSVVRVTALLLEGDELRARFECDGVVYAGTLAAAQPAVGEWLTLVGVGLHGQGLYVDLAGARVVTIQNLVEVNDGER